MKEKDRGWSERMIPGILALLLVLVVPPMLLAAEGEYVGVETCVQCHEEQGESFGKTAHGRAGLTGWDGAAGCEACHGSGAAHIDADGDPELMDLPEEIDPAAASAMCLTCHDGNTAAHWAGSLHDDADLSCASCHTVHAPWTDDKALGNRAVTDSCLTCHQDMRKHLMQRSRHPLKEGLMSCVDCHDPHGSATDAAMSAMSPNDKCYDCHAEKRGPFLYEHQPVREDCGTCHDPHGSNQTMMLTTAPPRLCQSCHLFGHHQTVPGQPGQVWNQNRSCVNCHPRIHGSNHPSGVIFMR